MLKTDCPKCKYSVTSPFLAEANKMVCTGCGETFSVKDIYISAGPYTIYRKVVLENTPKYVRLLKELQSEAAKMESMGKDSMPYMESAKTVKIFVGMLKELLDGCRDDARVSVGKTTLECSVGDTPFTGSIKNISSTGICINIPEKSHRVGPGRIIKLNVKDESLTEPLCLKAWVVWSTEKGITGLKFVGLEESSREVLHKFIIHKGSMEDESVRTPVGAGTGS